MGEEWSLDGVRLRWNVSGSSRINSHRFGRCGSFRDEGVVNC